MMINEGLPLYLVGRLEQRYDLASMTVGILGMAFKAESDDTRSSLSYKLRRILRFKARNVLCTDPYVTSDPDVCRASRTCSISPTCSSSVRPTRAYRDLDVGSTPIVDVWNLFERGVAHLTPRALRRHPGLQGG